MARDTMSTTVPTSNAASTTNPRSAYDDAAHSLPRWVNFIQDNLFLSFLILAEAYLLGTLMTLGWVQNIEQPNDWGAYHGVGVVLFFLAGAMAAGIALRCSVASANCFRRHEWGFALFNFVGVLAFCGSEVWASLSERSANLQPTPADQAVLALLGIQSLPVSPTIVVVALLLPFASLYYGFSRQRPPQQTAEEIEAEAAVRLAQERARAQLRLVRAEQNAAIRAAQARGWRGAVNAALAREEDEEPDPGPGGGLDDTGVQQQSERDGSPGARTSAWGAPAAGRLILNGKTAAQRIRATGIVTAADLTEVLGVKPTQALNILRSVEGASLLDGRWQAPIERVRHYLQDHSSRAMQAHYYTLEKALKPARGRGRSAQSDAEPASTTARVVPFPQGTMPIQQSAAEEDESAPRLSVVGRGQ